MARTHYPGRLAAEREFPHRVDVPVPDDALGRRLIGMLDWRREHVAADTWGQHHHSERRKGKAAVDCAQFYFLYEAVAEAFRRRLRLGRWLRPAVVQGDEASVYDFQILNCPLDTNGLLTA